MPESINYNKIITKGLGLASQKLRCRGGEEKLMSFNLPENIKRSYIEIAISSAILKYLI